MSAQLQIRNTETTMSEWQVIKEQSSTLIKSGLLPQSIKTPEQALAIILQGRELGIGTMAALQTINVIQGKPTVSPQLMLALINRSGQLEDIKIESNQDFATCMMKRRGRHSHTSKFGREEAIAMGLQGKDNYKKQSAVMYQWRAVAAAARAVFADVILGLYTPDEMGADVDVETGEILQPEPALKVLPSPAPIEIEEETNTDSEQAHIELDRAIIKEAAHLGWNDAKLKAVINKRYQVEDGLDALSISTKEEVLAGLVRKREETEQPVF